MTAGTEASPANKSLAATEDTELVRVLDAYLADVEAGRAVDLEQLLAAHPAIAPRLRACLASLQMVEKVADVLTTPTPAEPLPQLGDFRIRQEVGRGGMGIVYEGRHQLLTSRRAAIKVIRPGSGGDGEERRRFTAEAQAVAELQHPNIVPIYELGTYYQDGEERQFVALEYVEGDSLATAIDGTPLFAADADCLPVRVEADVAQIPVADRRAIRTAAERLPLILYGAARAMEAVFRELREVRRAKVFPV